MIAAPLTSDLRVAAAPHAVMWHTERLALSPRMAELLVLHVIAGQGRVLIGERVQPLQAGRVLLIWAGQQLCVLDTSEGFQTWSAVISDRFTIGRCDLPPIDGGGLEGEARRLPDATATTLDGLARQVVATRSPAAQAVGLHWWLMQAWEGWLRAPEEAGTKLHPAVAQTALALRADPALGAQAVAQAAGISPGRLGQIFRAEMGESLVGYRNAQKLNRVQSLVSDQGLEFAEAARLAGFGSYAQFFRAYRDRFGTGPREGKREGPRESKREVKH